MISKSSAFKIGLLLWTCSAVSFSFAFAPKGMLSQWSHREATARVSWLMSSTRPSESENDSLDEKRVTSFDDAGRSLIEEEDTKRMNEMGDFDSNPESQAQNVERMREAIRERASNLGVEKSKVSAQYIEQARERAAQSQFNSRPGAGGLDLSQISATADKKSDWNEDMPAMLYDPADELTEEERAEADEIGTKPIWEQAIFELKSSKWPDFQTATKQVGVMAVVAVLSCVLIIGSDKLLRNFYTDMGFIPSKDDIPGQLEGLSLPEGFTNNMNEDEISKLTEDLNSVSSN